jgi:chromosome segregation ATPase
MKRNKVWVALACLLALAALVGLSGAAVGTAQGRPEGEAETLAAVRTQFKAEVAGLRAEMLQQGVEFQEWKIKQLERELRRVEADDRGLEEAEQSVLRQIAEVEQGIAQSPAQGGEPRSEPSPEGEARALGEQEGARAELRGTHLKGVQSKRQPLAEQAAEIRAQIRDEEQRLQELRKRLQQLKAEGAVAPGR